MELILNNIACSLSYIANNMPAGALVTLGTRVSGGIVLTSKARTLAQCPAMAGLYKYCQNVFHYTLPRTFQFQNMADFNFTH